MSGNIICHSMANLVEITQHHKACGVYKRAKGADDVQAQMKKDFRVCPSVSTKGFPFYPIKFRGSDLLVRLCASKPALDGSYDKLLWSTFGMAKDKVGNNGGRIVFKQPLDTQQDAKNSSWVDEYGINALSGLVALLNPKLQERMQIDFPKEKKYADPAWFDEHIRTDGGMYHGLAGTSNEGMLMMSMFAGSNATVRLDNVDADWRELIAQNIKMTTAGRTPGDNKRSAEDAFGLGISTSFTPPMLACVIVRIAGIGFYCDKEGVMHGQLRATLFDAGCHVPRDGSLFEVKPINPASAPRLALDAVTSKSKTSPKKAKRVIMMDDDDEDGEGEGEGEGEE